MNSRLIFLLIAVVLPMLVSAKYAHQSSKWDTVDNLKGKRECKTADNCQELYGTKRSWECIKGVCQEKSDKAPNESISDLWTCTEEKCNYRALQGFRYTCSPQGLCVPVHPARAPGTIVPHNSL